MHFTFTRLLEAKEFASLRCQQVCRVCCNQRQEVRRFPFPRFLTSPRFPSIEFRNARGLKARFSNDKVSSSHTGFWKTQENVEKCRKHQKRTFLTNKLGSPHYALNVAKPVLSCNECSKKSCPFQSDSAWGLKYSETAKVLAPFARFPAPDSQASKIFQNGSQVKDFGRLCSNCCWTICWTCHLVMFGSLTHWIRCICCCIFIRILNVQLSTPLVLKIWIYFNFSTYLAWSVLVSQILTWAYRLL